MNVENPVVSRERNRTIIRCSLYGIVLNICLAVIKLAAGLMVRSTAIMLEALDSLSDSFSSVVSIISATIADQGPSKDHPMGLGRIEYLSSFVITILILLLGANAMFRSIQGLIHPAAPPRYTAATVVILVVSVILKWAYGFWCYRMGRSLSAAALVMAGLESLRDSLVSVGILIAIWVYRHFALDLEEWICLVISAAILKTGLEMLLDCTNKILGTRLDGDLRKKVYNRILAEDEVLNVYNLSLHNYGEGRYIGSVDIEVRDDIPVKRLAIVTRRIIRNVKKEGLVLTSVGFDCTDRDDPLALEIEDRIVQCAMDRDDIERVYGIMVDREEKIISFYIVCSLAFSEWNRVREEFRWQISEMYPDMRVEINYSRLF